MNERTIRQLVRAVADRYRARPHAWATRPDAAELGALYLAVDLLLSDREDPETASKPSEG